MQTKKGKARYIILFSSTLSLFPLPTPSCPGHYPLPGHSQSGFPGLPLTMGSSDLGRISPK